MNRKRKNRNLTELPTYTGQFNVPTKIQSITYSPHGFSEETISEVTDVESLFREILSSLVDLFLTNNDAKMNRVMKHSRWWLPSLSHSRFW